MIKNLKVAAVSTDIIQGDKATNLKSIENAMSTIDRDTDVVILPELFSTGFTSDSTKLAEWAETNGGDTITEIHRLSKLYNMAVIGSFLARTGSDMYNRAFFVEPGGDETFYDKRHLFSMSSEPKLLKHGRNELPVVRFRGWNIALSICYDLRFPVWCRNAGVKYDLLAVVANWPSSREFAWRHLISARAIENQAFVIAVDRSGNDKFGCYDNMTMAVDFYGKELPVNKSASNKELSYITLDHNSLDRWRSDFTAWQDSDKFNIDM